MKFKIFSAFILILTLLGTASAATVMWDGFEDGDDVGWDPVNTEDDTYSAPQTETVYNGTYAEEIYYDGTKVWIAENFTQVNSTDNPYVSFWWNKNGSSDLSIIMCSVGADWPSDAITYFRWDTAEMIRYEDNVGWNDIGTYSANQWLHVEFRDFNFSANTFDIYIEGVKKVDDASFYNAQSNFASFQLYESQGGSGYFDDIRVDDSYYSISGYIKDSGGSAFEGATVTNNVTATTNSSTATGFYQFSGLTNGTYEVTATKSGYFDNSTTVTVSGSDVTNQNITLKLAKNVEWTYPRTPAHSLEGESIEFYVNLSNQADVSWYLNGNLLYTNTSVTSATYTNDSGVYGCCYNLTIVESYGNGTHTWWWSVGNDTHWKVSHPLSTALSEYAHYMIKVDGDTWTLYNTTGGSEGSITVSNFWEMVWGDLRGFGCYNDSEQQRCYIQRDYENQVATIWVNLSAGSNYLNVTYGDSSGLPIGSSWSGEEREAGYEYVKEPYNVFNTFIDKDRYQVHDTKQELINNSEMGGGHWGPFIIDAGDKWIANWYNPRDVASDEINIMFSGDNGYSWEINSYRGETIPVSNISGDNNFPLDTWGDDQKNHMMVKAPNGDILILGYTQYGAANTRNGTPIFRSTDNGLSWTYEGKMHPNGNPYDDMDTLSYDDWTVVEGTIYVVVSIDGVPESNQGWAPGLVKSDDNGETWDWMSLIKVNDTGGEAGITYIGNNTLMSVVREHPDKDDTFLSYSYDMGQTWTSAESIKTNLSGGSGMGEGIVQMPRLKTFSDGVTYLYGRSVTAGTSHSGYTSVWYTTDGGETWSDEYAVDSYYDDTGYCDLLRENYSSLVVITYAGPGSGVYDIDFHRFSPPHLQDRDSWYSKMFNLSDYMTVSKEGNYLRLSGSGTDYGRCKMENLTVPNKYVLDVEGYNANATDNDQYCVFTYDGLYAAAQGFSVTIHPKWDEQTDATYHDGTDYVKFANWTEGKEYIVRHRVNESDNTTGMNYYLLETNYTQIASALNQPFYNGTPTDTDSLMIGDSSSAHPSDIYLDSVNFRKDADPSDFGSFTLVNESIITYACSADVYIDTGNWWLPDQEKHSTATPLTDGCDNATVGDTILIEPATYTEGVLFNKNLKLLGNTSNKRETRLQGDYTVDTGFLQLWNVTINGSLNLQPNILLEEKNSLVIEK